MCFEKCASNDVISYVPVCLSVCLGMRWAPPSYPKSHTGGQKEDGGALTRNKRANKQSAWVRGKTGDGQTMESGGHFYRVMG